MGTPTAHKTQKRELLRREILRAARTRFAREGYDNFSMRALASEIGCVPGTIYLYFDDRNELLRAVVEESFAELYRTLQALPKDDSPEEMLRVGLRAYIRFGLEHPDDYRCAFLLPVDQEQPYKVHPAFQILKDRVRACVNAGIFRKIDVDTASQVLWSCIHGITSLLISRPAFPWVAREKLIDEMLRTAIGGMLSPKASRK